MAALRLPWPKCAWHQTAVPLLSWIFPIIRTRRFLARIKPAISLLWTINAPMLENAFRTTFADLGGEPPPKDEPIVARFRGRAALDLSARPFLVWNVDLPTPKIGTFDTELVREFFQALSTHGGITLHVDALHGLNSHHMAEAAFKAVARALRDAVEVDPRKSDAVPSTKGAL